MIFSGGTSEFTVIDVLRIKRTGEIPSGKSGKKPVGYLSCRLSGFSEIELPDKTLRLDTEHYLLCPPYAEYTHHYHEEEVIAVHLSFAKNPPLEMELIHNTSPEVKNLFSELHTLWTEKQTGYLCRCKSILYNILYQFETSECRALSSRIDPSMEYFYANYKSADFDLKEMISKSFMSEAYFRRFFRKLYGCSIVEFLNRLRVEQAKALIKSRRYTIAQIAEMSGFSDEKYFSQVFRKQVGCSPTKYGK